MALKILSPSLMPVETIIARPGVDFEIFSFKRSIKIPTVPSLALIVTSADVAALSAPDRPPFLLKRAANRRLFQ